MNKEKITIHPTMYSIQCLLDNFMEAYMEFPENTFEEAYQELKNKMKERSFFDAEQYSGSIEIEGKYVNALNCGKVIGLIY